MTGPFCFVLSPKHCALPWLLADFVQPDSVVDAVRKKKWAWGGVCLLCALMTDARGGGSGLNTMVVINQNSPDSQDLANYFCEQRCVPPENVLRITWTGDNRAWSDSQFSSRLLSPLLNQLNVRQLTNQIDYVVLSMDIPFQTISNGSVNSTTSALFYGLKAYGGSDPGVTNSYAQSELVFAQSPPASAPGVSFLTTMITGDTLETARRLIDQGVASDGMHPSQPVVLEKTSDPSRNLRHLLFDNAIINVKIRDNSAIVRVNSDETSGQSGFFGVQTGLDKWTLSPGTFVSGAIADSMTSFGGIIFGPNAQSNLLSFLNAGAAGSYGTVAEPLTDTQKFPDPQVYFYQARGFSLAESYYQSVTAPHLGLMVAEPLAAPFARPGVGRWEEGLSNATLSGSVTLNASFSAADADHPLQQVDLFLDGKFWTTTTTLSPSAGNVMTVSLNGYSVSYAVPANATLPTVVSELAAQINHSTNLDATKVKALVRGDRIELQSTATNHQNFPFYITDDTSMGSTGATYRIRYFPESFPPRILASEMEFSGDFRLELEIPTALPYAIQASTNLANWVEIGTNTIAGLRDFVDVDSTNHARRFYRVVGPRPDQPPMLTLLGLTNGRSLGLRLESLPGQPCALLTSSNLTDWFSLFTNQTGGVQTFVDPLATSGTHGRFYRAWLVPPAPPSFAVIQRNGTNLIRVEGATRPYIVEVSTNPGHWTALATNFAIGEIQAFVTSAVGSAGSLTTFLKAGQPRFFQSPAQGFQKYSAMAASLTAGDWVEFTITKTNGQSTTVATTNQLAGATSASLFHQVCNLINANPLLQAADGVIAEDFVEDAGGIASFYLRARSPGYQAAGIGAQVRRSGIAVLPSSYRALRSNLSDLQPRNHLYLTTGAMSLPVAIPMDTRTLADGHHELTAVAYEGSSVRTQTRTTTPIVVSNSSLHAELTFPSQNNTWSVTNVFEVDVSVNTNTVGAILLYSTGGFLMGATNQAAASFAVNGELLGAGKHPFYALVTTTNGQRYRTQTRTVTLTRP